MTNAGGKSLPTVICNNYANMRDHMLPYIGTFIAHAKRPLSFLIVHQFSDTSKPL